ncbi:hypothetical protein CRE_25646 [Caenorhabditis remanei]|uniref:Uncharacterized protein n=1 Tax=Caenorhabditis remanei TaxID=31234 RepID=E3ML72_CAERE|nr:hypothetical protein CRE_25646 [Caenorhabditis remanei]
MLRSNTLDPPPICLLVLKDNRKFCSICYQEITTRSVQDDALNQKINRHGKEEHGRKETQVNCSVIRETDDGEVKISYDRGNIFYCLSEKELEDEKKGKKVVRENKKEEKTSKHRVEVKKEKKKNEKTSKKVVEVKKEKKKDEKSAKKVVEVKKEKKKDEKSAKKVVEVKKEKKKDEKSAKKVVEVKKEKKKDEKSAKKKVEVKKEKKKDEKSAKKKVEVKKEKKKDEKSAKKKVEVKKEKKKDEKSAKKVVEVKKERSSEGDRFRAVQEERKIWNRLGLVLSWSFSLSVTSDGTSPGSKTRVLFNGASQAASKSFMETDFEAVLNLSMRPPYVPKMVCSILAFLKI